ncbi:Integrase core domain protein [Neochlamydia sp. TUME1]|uniref:hypothetical protein n=1 Tax=Neochlamydia sp. TUME1 TaxID=1478174 RepID=UPI0005839C93|nr:hypothetical protein [Neochlamydia sp. TUME1]KIC76564.1 Integrase core domain protein [Neochlamydia sp. TUME1]
MVAQICLNDQVIPWFKKQDVRALRILTDHGTEYCGARENHEYELYLAIENISHSRTNARHPLNQWNLRKILSGHPKKNFMP